MDVQTALRADSRRAALAWARRSRWLRLIVAAAIVQLLYWHVFLPTIKDTPPLPEGSIIWDGEVAALPEPTIEAFNAATFEPAVIPVGQSMYEACCERHYGNRFRFTIEGEPDGDLGAIVAVAADNHALYVNGFLVDQRGRLEDPHTYHTLQKRLVRVPEHALRAGENEAQLITTRAVIPYTDFYPFVIADYDELDAASQRRFFILNDMEMITASLVGLIALIALAMIPQAKNRAIMGWLFALSLFWCLRNTYYFMVDPPMGDVWRVVYYFAISLGLAFALVCFVDAWTGARRSWPRWALAGVGGALAAGIGVALFNDFPPAYDAASEIANYAFLFAGLAAAGRFVWHMAVTDEDRTWEVAALSLLAAALAYDAYSELRYNTVGGAITRATPFFLVMLMAAIVARNVKLFESMSAFNAELAQTLTEREDEIRTRYDELRAAQHAKAVAEERQRILRDMHDGLGGTLSRLLMRARVGKASSDEVAEGLQTGLDDLRLVIESVDRPDASLEDLLRALARRWAHAAEAQDVAFTSDIADLALDWDSRSVLDVCRIVQEAVSNALRHGAPQTIRLSAAIVDDALAVTIADDGSGVPDGAEAAGGRGLANMRARAEGLGGHLAIASAQDGTTVTLSAPAAPARQPMTA